MLNVIFIIVDKFKYILNFDLHHPNFLCLVSLKEKRRNLWFYEHSDM